MAPPVPRRVRRPLAAHLDPWVIVILSDAGIPNQRGAQQESAATDPGAAVASALGHIAPRGARVGLHRGPVRDVGIDTRILAGPPCCSYDPLAPLLPKRTYGSGRVTRIRACRAGTSPRGLPGDAKPLTRVPHFRWAFGPPCWRVLVGSGGGVEAGGDVERVEDLVLEVGEFGREGA